LNLQQEVSERLGLGVSRLILSCLSCLEGGMGDPSIFEDSKSTAAIKFQEIMTDAFVMELL
jgi:hypothetical protein